MKQKTYWLAAAAIVSGSMLWVQAGAPILLPGGQPVKTFARAPQKRGLSILSPRIVAEQSWSKRLSLVMEKDGGDIKVGVSSGYRPSAEQASPPSRQVDPALLKELRKQQAQKKNWAFAETEDDEAAADAAFGIRTYSYESIEKDSENSDPTFRGVGEPDSSLPSPEEIQAAIRFREERNTESTAQRSAQDQSFHTMTELSFEDIMGNSSGSLLKSDSSRSDGSALMGMPANPMASRPLNSARARDLLNSSPDASRQSLQPLVGQSPPRADRSSRLESIGSDFRSNPLMSPAGNNREVSRITGFSVLPTPSFNQNKPSTYDTRSFSERQPGRF